MDIEGIIQNMSLREKIAFCTGRDFWHTKPLARHGVPQIMLADGPHGLRAQKADADMLGINQSLPATCFPTAVTAGATWNRELYAKEGFAIGREAMEAGVSVVLGPGCNIKRDPRGGRNFEYLSEDPYLAGRMAAAFIRGLQRTGVSACVKHFAVNSQEYKRMNGDSRVDERTLREIYLTPFEFAVKEGKTDTVMCSYNKINGTHASDHKTLLTDVLRTEWGFDGTVVTDWGAMHDRVAAFAAGCDLNMPGGSRYMARAVARAVEQGTLSEADIDASVRRILRLVEKHARDKKRSFDREAHHALALKIARQGGVLLKNDDHVLPLSESDAVLIGAMALAPRYQGSGSSHINPTRLVGIAEAMPNTPVLSCGDAMGNVSDEELASAARAAAAAKTAVVVVGLPDCLESEGFDRPDLRLPDGYLRLVDAVLAKNPRTVVVLLGGGVMELPFADRVKAILYMGLPGQAGGAAVADLLTGRAVPCGKLTESWPMCYEDTVTKETFGEKNVEYREGIYVGYRYYDKAQKAVRYPFGHGLSYTSFAYSDLSIEKDAVAVTVTNVGDVPGAEVVQMYIAPPQDGAYRPLRELKGFARTELMPGESRRLRLPLDARSFAVWQDGWCVPSGRYTVEIGASSRDIRLSQTVEIEGTPTALPAIDGFYADAKGTPTRAEWMRLMGGRASRERSDAPFDMDSTCLEMAERSSLLRLLGSAATAVISFGLGVDGDPQGPTCRMMVTGALDCPMRAAVINTGGKLSEPMAKALVFVANSVPRGRTRRRRKGHGKA